MDLEEILIPIFVCVVLPVAIVLIISLTNRFRHRHCSAYRHALNELLDIASRIERAPHGAYGTGSLISIHVEPAAA